MQQRARSRSHPRSQVLFFADASTYQHPSKKACKSVSQKSAREKCVHTAGFQTCAIIYDKNGICFCKKLPDPCFQCSMLAISIDDGQYASRDFYDADPTAPIDLPVGCARSGNNTDDIGEHVSINQQQEQKLQSVSIGKKHEMCISNSECVSKELRAP